MLVLEDVINLKQMKINFQEVQIDCFEFYEFGHKKIEMEVLENNGIRTIKFFYS